MNTETLTETIGKTVEDELKRLGQKDPRFFVLFEQAHKENGNHAVVGCGNMPKKMVKDCINHGMNGTSEVVSVALAASLVRRQNEELTKGLNRELIGLKSILQLLEASREHLGKDFANDDSIIDMNQQKKLITDQLEDHKNFVDHCEENFERVTQIYAEQDQV